jgi:hypothetical protein
VKWREHKLDGTILKADETITLSKTENCSVEIMKGTLADAVKLDNQRKGFIFHGQGRLLLDAMVETERGTAGRPVDRELREPFLMLGDTRDIEQHLRRASAEDLKNMHYRNEEEFARRAEELCDRFFKKTRIDEDRNFGKKLGLVFVFPNEEETMDILIVNDSELVYKGADKVFISNKDNVILKTGDELVLNKNGRSLFTRNKCCF